jgi:hypothetical protein
MRETRPMRVHPMFSKRIADIRAKRARHGMDKDLISRGMRLSSRRLTLAISRYNPLWDDLERADFIKDDKAQMEQSVLSIFTFMVVAFAAVVIFGGMIWTMGLLNSTFTSIGLLNEVNAGQPGYTNMTIAAQSTFGQVNDSIQALRLVAITLIFTEALAFMVFMAFAKRHPVLFIVYIFIIVLAVIFAASISNAYYTLLQSDIFDGILVSFTGANWFVLNLPIVVAVTGIMGGIFMFINIIRGSEDVGV